MLEVENVDSAMLNTCLEDDICCSLRLNLTSSRELNCRICLEDDRDSNLIAPCECRGSVQYVHDKCLQQWFEVMHTKQCQICKTEYELEDRGMKPMIEWTLPRPISDDWEDQLDFKCAIFWLLFMARIVYVAIRFGPTETRSAIMQVLGGGRVYYVWVVSFMINFVYYSMVIYSIMKQWKEINSIYVWKNKSHKKVA